MAAVGRPRTFDKDQALSKAMLVFWEKGYEGTTMSDLVDAIGMKPPSIYAAFGNKDALFTEVVAHYLPIIVNGQLNVLSNTPNIKTAVAKTMDAAVHLFASDDNPHTCLIMTAAINTSPDHLSHVATLKNLRSNYRKTWATRFEQAKADQQITEAADPNALASYFATLVQGMALSARDGASKNDLMQTAAIAQGVLASFLT